MVIDATHAALEDAEKAFDRVGRGFLVPVAACVFLIAVVHGLMVREGLARLLVELRFVGVQRAVQHDICAKKALDCGDGEIIYTRIIS